MSEADTATSERLAELAEDPRYADIADVLRAGSEEIHDANAYIDTMQMTLRGHNLTDENGELRKIVGTLPVTKDGAIVGHGAVLHYHDEPYEGSLATENNCVFFEVVRLGSCGDVCGAWEPTNKCYSTKEASAAARKDNHA